MEANATDKPVPRKIIALLSDERLILRETQRAVTPFGGIAVFISFLGKIGFAEAVRQHMPICWKSPNHIEPTATFTAFLISVLAGARRFAHTTPLRGDHALHALLAMDCFPHLRRHPRSSWPPTGDSPIAELWRLANEKPLAGQHPELEIPTLPKLTLAVQT
ncbi:MAG TPA: hypothetical protein VHW24_23300 [Bryobacteraceae bacterium]|nr:hypothetical protein [Bryobacteraceae bacterium]